MTLTELLDRPIAFQRAFVRIGAGITGALMLSQAVYWTNRTRDSDGWFYKTMADWEEETGMTRYEQERARRALVSRGLLEEQRKGIPAKLYFRVNMIALRDALLGSVKTVTLDDVLSIYGSQLNSLSRVGLMRAKKLEVEAEYVDYAEILKRDGMVCGCCKQPILYGPGQLEQALAFDHVRPLAAGGAHVAKNITPAHAGCNGRKGKDYDIEEEEEGAHASLLNLNILDDLPQQSSLLNVNKLDCLEPTDRPASPKKSIYTETTTETTAETTTLPGRVVDPSEPAQKIPGPKDPEAITYDTWQAYSKAYHNRYGVHPIWNKANGGKIAQVISRVGKEAAPEVARFYLSLNDAFYVRKMHAVGNLLSDCEAIHTQWATGRTMTQRQAVETDRRQATGNMAANLADKLRAQGRMA